MTGETSGNNVSKELWVYVSIAIVTLIVVLILSVRACHRSTGTADSPLYGSVENPETAAVTAIRQNSRLYTAEATAKKTMTFSSQNKLSFKFAGVEKDINIPLGKTEATIPVTVTYKAYIDLSKVTANDVTIINDTAIVVTLPDPVVVETAVAVDHDNESMKKQLFAKGLTAEQYKEMVHQAKENAWNELDEQDQRAIVETAKVSATDILLPQLRTLGFQHIRIDYRPDFSISKLIDIEKK